MEIGRVVSSLKGRDKGYLLAVLSVTKDGVLVVDGKERPLSHPKLKNIKHVEKTNVLLTCEQMATNRELRRNLRCVRNKEVN